MKRVNVSKFIFVVLVVITISFNVSMVSDDKIDVAYLALIDVEAFAQGGEVNNWTEWFTQGLTKDESERPVQCQPGNNTSGVTTYVTTIVNGVPVTVAVTVGTSSPAGTSKITCGYGSENCTPTDC